MRNIIGSITFICFLLVLSAMGCRTDRTSTMFGLSRDIPDSTTDPERLNRELEDDLRQIELKRMEKMQAAPKPVSAETGDSR